MFIKLLIAILVISLLLPFTFLKDKHGNPMLSVGDLNFPSLTLPELSMPDFLSSGMPKLPGGVKGSDGKDMIYQWTDADGNVQFSNSQPPEGVVYTLKGYDPNLNVIQAVETQAAGSEEVSGSESKKKITSAKDIGSPYSVERIEKLFEDANNIEKLLNQRLNNQAAEIGQ
ncbi:hypothetical protein MnTg03_01218 [bacterium MnTg03]|nr:hypothetical protein MnTg03_01218 [bacterium MnTg03]